MKIAKKDIAVLMVIVGLIAAFCSYKFYFSGKLEEIDAENSKQASIQTEIDKVSKVAATDTDMNNQVAKWAKEVDEMVGRYDVAYQYEDGILFMKSIETQDAFTAAIDTYTVGETVLANTVVGQGEFGGKSFLQGTTTYSFNYKVDSYDSLKKLIDYIVSDKNGVKTLDSMTFAVSGEGFTGSATMTVYSLADGSAAYTAPTISGVETGVDRIFPEPEE